MRLVTIVREPIAAYLSWYNHRLTQPELFWASSISCPAVVQPLARGLAPSFEFLALCELGTWERACGHAGGAAVNMTCLESQSALHGSRADGVMNRMDAAHLERWTRVWPRRQLLVLQFEHLVLSFPDALRRLRNFYGLPQTTAHVASLPRVNARKSTCKLSSIPCGVRRTLQTMYAPWNDALNLQLAHDRATGAAHWAEAAVAIGNSTVACHDTGLGPSLQQVNLSRCQAYME
jgi:hypothetical protein